MPDLETLVSAARRAALEPEQPLLRMLSRRRASPAALKVAQACYERAAGLIGEALALISVKSGESKDE